MQSFLYSFSRSLPCTRNYWSMNEKIFSHVVFFTSFGSKQKSQGYGSLNTDQIQYSGLSPDQGTWIHPRFTLQTSSFSITVAVSRAERPAVRKQWWSVSVSVQLCSHTRSIYLICPYVLNQIHSEPPKFLILCWYFQRNQWITCL